MTFQDNFIATHLCIAYSRDILRKCPAITQQYAWPLLFSPSPFPRGCRSGSRKGSVVGSSVAKLYIKSWLTFRNENQFNKNPGSGGNEQKLYAVITMRRMPLPCNYREASDRQGTTGILALSYHHLGAFYWRNFISCCWSLSTHRQKFPLSSEKNFAPISSFAKLSSALAASTTAAFRFQYVSSSLAAAFIIPLSEDEGVYLTLGYSGTIRYIKRPD